ncbi:MATE family efflux transporter [Larsenimonas sp. GH2-1]|uniref:Multidrug-efflux transporter n=1 Tax=Larsenimonas rhizosphaerae TaxID=2944682 RepID=A0AA41ZLB5_9GAMM|nr:MATE family efflux transporter [Larsenimonas rhizosphaerae]
MTSLLQRSLTEARPLIRLTLPIFGAQLAQAGMGTVDVMMAGNASATDLAAVSVGTSLWIPLILFITGTLMGLTPIVAHCMGAHRAEDVSTYKRQALWAAIFMGLIAMAALQLAPPWLFAVMNVPDTVAMLSTQYLTALSFGLPAVALYQALRAYSDGLNHSRPSLMFSLLGLVLNIPANGILIFGGNGLQALFGNAIPESLAALPALGAYGCGIATAISMWVMCLGMYLYTRHARAYRHVRSGRGMTAPHYTQMMELLRIGFPIGVAIFTETTLFTLIALLIAGLGEVVVSAHQIALNFTSLMFMLPMSIGMALTVRVSHALGQNQPCRARFVAWNGIVLSLMAALINNLILWQGSHVIPSLYTGNTEVQALASQLILVAIIYQVSDVLQVSMAGALRGYKDTRIIMIFTLLAYWVIGLGSGLLLGRSAGWGVFGYWSGLILGLSAAALLLGIRLHRQSRLMIRAQPLNNH